MNSRVFSVMLLALGCAGPQPEPTVAEEEGPEPVVVTLWSDRTELFVEFPPLRPGETSRFAVHLTDLKSFEPLREGSVDVRLDYPGGESRRFVADTPSRPGIFGVDVVPPRSGNPSVTVSVRSPGIEDSHGLGPTPVGEDPSGAGGPSAEGGLAGGISFLKEQQWTLDFATEVARPVPIRESLLVPATVEVRSGGRLAVTAPVSGRLLPTPHLPVLGDFVEDEQELGAIVPSWAGPPDLVAVRLAVDQSTLALETARRERRRAERLLAAGAVPERRVQDALAREALVSAQLDAANMQLERYEVSRRDSHDVGSDAAFTVRAHLAGVVTSVLVKDGAHVREGDVLLEVAATDSVHVSGAIPESRSAALGRLAGAEIQLPGSGDLIPVRQLVAAGRLVNPATRTLKATYLADNRDGRLAIGQALLLRIFTSEPVEAPGVPVTAVVSDGGQSLAYVQTGGESFEERRIVLGSRTGRRVHVTAGLKEGERIVTRGAYLVRLASMSTEVPAHGHVH